MNRLGYHQQYDKRSGQVSYVRRISSLGYPRFHLYINEKRGGLAFNLHFDEKKPSYSGQTAHSGQYEGELVGYELARIKSILLS